MTVDYCALYTYLYVAVGFLVLQNAFDYIRRDCASVLAVFLKHFSSQSTKCIQRIGGFGEDALHKLAFTLHWQWIEFVSRTASQPRPRRLRCRHLGNAGCASTEPRGLCTTSVSWTTVITVATGTKNSTSGSRLTSRTACCGSMETAQTTFTSASVYVAIAVYTLSSCTHFGLLSPRPRGHFGRARAVRLSVPCAAV